MAITPELDGLLATEAEAARQAVREAEKAQRDAAAAQRTVTRRLKASGLSGADIAAVLKVSAQRVSQLVNSWRGPLLAHLGLCCDHVREEAKVDGPG